MRGSLPSSPINYSGSSPASAINPTFVWFGCSPLASDAAETRRTLDFCARLAAGIVACPPRAAGEGMPGSPATGTVADLASVFGGATPRTSSPVHLHHPPCLASPVIMSRFIADRASLPLHSCLVSIRCVHVQQVKLVP